MRFILLATALIATIATEAQKPAPKKSATTAAVNPLKNNTDSCSYGIGVSIFSSLKQQGLNKLNLNVLQKALSDAYYGKPSLLSPELIQSSITTYMQKAQSEKATKAKQEGKAFLDANGKRKNVITMPEGWQYEVIQQGKDSISPTMANSVKCNYRGTLLNGEEFDGSAKHGGPITFALGQVVSGWQLALQKMTVGSKWKIYLPSDLAYGDMGNPPVIPPGATLIFELELLEVIK
ncbi:MAG: FKBP-type peptidyl-prolyl cis-trans isomerase [Phycisphaerales bacterium]|nr:FKBP-type peptidyl-prolyl cis-trans isomerase [Phycisphaerales bacterium]